jgi:ribosomal-protein-alanine N-acetyltransferase
MHLLMNSTSSKAPPTVMQEVFRPIQTTRLTLTALKEIHSDSLFALRSNQQVLRYVDKEADKSVNDTQEFIAKIENGIAAKKCYYWGIFDRGGENLIGTICIWMFNASRTEAEIGFELLPDHQGKGFMNEAALGVIKFGFSSLQLQTIKAYTRMNNQPAIRLLKKLGFQLFEIKEETAIYSLASPKTTS